MSPRPNTNHYLDLFINDIPMMDVRAPVEFQKGAFPGVVNVPLMNDHERQLVGTRYKEAGQDSAIELGHDLVSGQVKAERVEQWSHFAKDNPQGYLYCFRGGLRSRITQQWLREAGIDYPLVVGGYKAMRRFLIDNVERLCNQQEIVLVSGRTGSGKTEFLHGLNKKVDLEHLAHHRGSSFGRLLEAQPSQINFENSLSVALLKAETQGEGQLFIEDESRLIGRCSLPLTLKRKMETCPVIVLESGFDERVQRVLQAYVLDMFKAYSERDGELKGFECFRAYLLGSLQRIERRLGSERKQQLEDIMKNALAEQQKNNQYDLHRIWIEMLLRDYYDPMYDYQLSGKTERIIMRGDQHTLREKLQLCV